MTAAVDADTASAQAGVRDPAMNVASSGKACGYGHL